jgi:SAM-dependent methyltransferase
LPLPLGMIAQKKAGENFNLSLWHRVLGAFKPRNAAVPPQDYQTKLAQEKGAYADCVNVHDLPAIHHYWASRYLCPKLEAFGFSNPIDLFTSELARQCARDANRQNEFFSIGSGNCDTEIELAQALCRQGYENFRFECLDLNQSMLDRGKQLAAERGVSAHLGFVQGDFNKWQPAKQYDAVLAHQALHHVLKLEHLFKSVKRALKPDGLFVVSDMIGRNGHMRWPEALSIVHEFWRELPASYRYNQQLKRQEELYENWDCSTEGFEGIRAQDILPLLVKNFKFELFIGFANLISPFIDRGFGHNFDPAREWDRNFIDRVHERDEEEMNAGRIKPTQMLAVLRNEKVEALRYHPPLTPEFCIRKPD